MCTITAADAAGTAVTISAATLPEEINCFTVASGTPTSATTLSTLFLCLAAGLKTRRYKNRHISTDPAS
jgi:hypothetical protein